MFEQIISLIAPHYCLDCQKEGSLLCYECQNMLLKIDTCYRCRLPSGESNLCRACSNSAPFHKMFATTSYQGIAKELVYKCKFQRASAATAPMARRMTNMPFPLSRDVLITHIPTATSRIRARGYDQAQLIARNFAQEMGMYHTPLLGRLGQRRQVGQGGEARRSQLRHAFYVRYPQIIAERDVVLIDDVITTGSTMEAAALVLKQAGARRVYGLVFALA
jgi:ComF family protein